MRPGITGREANRFCHDETLRIEKTSRKITGLGYFPLEGEVIVLWRARAMVRSTPAPFQRLDGLVLIFFSLLGLNAALRVDAEFMGNRWYFDAGNPMTFLPGWVLLLELPAKRIQFDFMSFLIVVTPGVGLVTFRHRSSWNWNWLPAPGIAVSAVSVLTLIHHVTERAFLVYYHSPSERQLGLIWPRGNRFNWSPLDWGCGISVTQIAMGVEGAILGAWAYLILARAWKASDDWRDFLGRWLAWCWLADVAFGILAPALWG
jgi:hypothetical protein